MDSKYANVSLAWKYEIRDQEMTIIIVCISKLGVLLNRMLTHMATGRRKEKYKGKGWYILLITEVFKSIG